LAAFEQSPVATKCLLGLGQFMFRVMFSCMVCLFRLVTERLMSCDRKASR